MHFSDNSNGEVSVKSQKKKKKTKKRQNSNAGELPWIAEVVL